MQTITRTQAFAAVCALCALFVTGTLVRRHPRRSVSAPLSRAEAPTPAPANAMAPTPAPPDAAPPANTPDSATLTVTPVPPRPPVTVHVVGCVNQPGVYSFEEGARMVDAVKRAGGAKANADLEAVNLAARLSDGSQVYVPRKPAATPPPASAPPPVANRPPPGRVPLARPAATAPVSTVAAEASGGGKPEKLTSPAQGRVRLNSADAAELQRLPGVGPATAAKILEYRQAHGPFQSIDELIEVRGIGEKRLAEMRPFLEL